MTFPVVWLMPDVPRVHVDSPYRLTWSQAMVENILTRAGGTHFVGFDQLPDDEPGAVVVVPAEYYTDRVDWLNTNVNNLDWAVVILTSDECSRFPVSRLQHRLDRLRVWVQTPRPGQHTGDRFLPFGPPPDTRRMLGERTSPAAPRRLDWVFAGQVNHPRRRQLVDVLDGMDGGELVTSGGFAQGLNRGDYLALLAEAKVTPCPGGIGSPDSFRAWEALEAGCLPVVDARCPAYASDEYWSAVFGELPPFPIVDEWAAFPELLDGLLAGWPGNAVRAQAWWLQYQQGVARRIVADVADVSGQQPNTAPITVLVPTSPIVSHPSTALIEDTVASVRYHLPDAPMVVMCDGVRVEQDDRRADYDEYLHRVMWLCSHVWGNVVPIVADDHQHQANMTRRALRLVDTPLVLFVEHDTPLVVDEPIDWPAIVAALSADELDVVRFHHEAHVLDVHRYLMLDDQPRMVGGCPVLRTTQWSQRPHVARTDFYRRILEDYFPVSCRTMIEDHFYSVCQRYPWRFNRLALYAPAGQMKRSLHSDGRAGAEKFEMVTR